MHITGLGCIIGHNVVRVTKSLSMNYVKMFIYVHVTEPGCIIGYNVV